MTSPFLQGILLNPTLSFNNTLNSLRLISLIKELQYCDYKNIPIVLISTKEQNLHEMLKLNNLKNLANNEIKERTKYGPNIDIKIFSLSSKNEITTDEYKEYLLGPRKKNDKFVYEIKLILSENLNYNKIYKFSNLILDTRNAFKKFKSDKIVVC